jgi:hypothetical protein
MSFFYFSLLLLALQVRLSRSKFYGHGLDDAFILELQLTLAIIRVTTNSYELVIASFITLTAFCGYLRYRSIDGFTILRLNFRGCWLYMASTAFIILDILLYPLCGGCLPLGLLYFGVKTTA